MGFKGILVFMAHSLGLLTYLQGRNSDADIENQNGDMGPGEGRVGQIGRVGLMYIHLYTTMYKIDS